MKKRNTKQVILPLITSFIWGSSFVAQSLGAGKVGGFTFTAARSIPAVLVLGALVLILRRVRHEEKYTPQQKKDLLYLNFHGTGFLQNMVRILTGTLLEVGFGKRSVESVKEVLEAKDRKLAGYTAPPQGLCLMRVDY